MTVLKTWSKFTINLPYSTIGFALGEPIHVPRDLSEDELETYRKKVEDAQNETTVRAYQLAGADINRTLPAHAATGPLPPGALLNGYRGLTTVLKPAMPALLAYRTRRGKEDLARRGERLGVAGIPRPNGRLVWFHAASVGETNAALPIIHRFVAAHPDIRVLLTTGTVTSARIASERLPAAAIHQYLPLDVTGYVRAFLDHWRPELAVFVESEIWPNLVMETAGRKIPLLLVNGRMSGRSHRNWSRRQTSAAAVFSRIDRVLAQNETFSKRFTKLGARSVVAIGNLKVDAPPPPVDAAELQHLRAIFAGRPILLAASTHKGEESQIAEAYRTIIQSHPEAQLIIAPRHPGRGDEVANELAALGFSSARRSKGELPGPDRQVYIADTIGELGTFYALAKLAFIGGSLIPHGGQNPLEPIKLGCGLITGPNWQNFEDFYEDLLDAKAAREVADSAALAATVNELIADPAALASMAAKATATLRSLGGALDRTLLVIDGMLAKPGSAGG